MIPDFSSVKIGILAIVAAVAVAAVGGFMLYVRHLSSENAKLTANNAVLQGALDTEKAVREELDRERVRSDRFVAASIADSIARAAADKPIRREIIHAPAPTQPLAVCAPATDRVLGRLRERAGGGEAGSNPPVAPAGLAPVPARP